MLTARNTVITTLMARAASCQPADKPMVKAFSADDS